nr:hypothetical protein [Arthrobacter sp. JCM 19049]
MTPSELTDLAFSDKVTQKLREHEIPPECLVIEVTEERYISGDRPELYSLRAFESWGFGSSLMTSVRAIRPSAISANCRWPA